MQIAQESNEGFLVFTSVSWLLLFNRNNQKSCFKLNFLKFLKKFLMLHRKVMNQSHEDLAKSGYTFFLQMW
jgi:hypothetical protein